MNYDATLPETPNIHKVVIWGGEDWYRVSCKVDLKYASNLLINSLVKVLGELGYEVEISESSISWVKK